MKKTFLFLIAILMYTSLVSAFLLFGLSVYRIIADFKKKAKKQKPYVVAAGCLIYLLLIAWLGFERFGTLFSIVFILFAIITTQQQKHKDRAAGRRWWTR